MFMFHAAFSLGLIALTAGKGMPDGLMNSPNMNNTDQTKNHASHHSQ